VIPLRHVKNALERLARVIDLAMAASDREKALAVQWGAVVKDRDA